MTVQQEQLAPPEVGAAREKASWWDSPQVQSLRERLGKLPWQVWAIALVLASSSVGFTATALLLKLPQNPNCPRIFWPIASASMRIYCAQLEAEAGTVESLLRAIELVAALPQDHPLRQDIERSIEEWAVKILDLADQEFQAGKLEEAIAIARQIPNHTSAYNLIEERIARWQSTWAEGEAIFAEVERQLRASEWNQAFREAVKLLNLDNKYWATVKYDETVKRITLAQEDSKQLDRAHAVLGRGGLDNWLQAITEAEKIPRESYAYQEAQNLIARAKEKLLDYATDLLGRRNWQALMEMADRLPDSLALKQEVDGWKMLAKAGLDAQLGTPEGMEIAIATAGQIDRDSPLYQTAQELRERWKLEIQDVAHLAKARELAGGGTTNELNAAIGEAQLIPAANPRYKEAQAEIQDWTRQIQTIEDQPLLERARTLAQPGTISALQAAIAQASLIGSSRALYGEAREEIRTWQQRIEVQEDQPYLDRSIAFSNAKDYSAAIDAASQIRRGRALYREARANIRRWQREVQAQQDLQEAYLAAGSKTPEALAAAMKIVRRIPAATDVKQQSLMALNRWSYQLLAMANTKASAADFSEAIRLARMVPRDSAAYDSAQSQIASWQQALQPVPPPLPEAEAGSPEVGVDSPQ